MRDRDVNRVPVLFLSFSYSCFLGAWNRLKLRKVFNIVSV